MKVDVGLLLVADQVHPSPVKVVAPDFGGVHKAISRGVMSLHIDATLRKPELVTRCNNPVFSLEEVPGEVGRHAVRVAAHAGRLVGRLVVLFGHEDRVAAQTEGVVGVLAPASRAPTTRSRARRS